MVQRNFPLTYRGALQILGVHDHSRIEKIDRLLGGIILGAGAAAGLSALISSTGAPLALMAIWTWLEQRDEALKLLRASLDGISNHLQQTRGYERHQLIAAAHTTIAAASFFEALQANLGKARYATLAITKDEKASLAFGPESASRRLIEVLYEAPVPVPSPARGFEESIPSVKEWMSDLSRSTEKFLEGLECWKEMKRPLDDRFIASAVDRYRSNYLKIAAKVPEFWIWASLGEHAATRNRVSAMSAEMRMALEEHTAALARLEAVLSLGTHASSRNPERDLCEILYRANRGVLHELIVPEAIAPNTYFDVKFPSVEKIYLNPRYRVATFGDSARPTDESWWAEHKINSNLDLLLAGQFTTPDAVHMPVLLLGHPGAGKSLLTQVVAARLPASTFTTVRVPLRRVHADAPVYEQIQQALDAATHRRIDWWQLAEQSSATIRVVLLDGFDELLQAAGHRGDYLQELVDFQRREYDQERPVVIFVTARTVVADRITIPPGTTMIKLEGFSDDQVGEWLEIWNEINGFRAGSNTAAGILNRRTALQHRELAMQPLLLLMLALYTADPASPPIGAGLSPAALYRQLLHLFIHREIAKSKDLLNQIGAEESMRDHLWRLSVAAFAMFNRGRQDVTDVELGADLAALGGTESLSVRPTEAGKQLIGRFFFVHIAEGQSSKSNEVRRGYEFLHATFGEYLMARYIIEILSGMASEFANSRVLDDSLLYALLSTQPLATTKIMLNFAGTLLAEFPSGEREQVYAILELLLADCRQKGPLGKYADYGPPPNDNVRRLAAYSANLTILRITLDDDGKFFELSQLYSTLGDPTQTWRSTVTLWRSGLDINGFQAMLSALVYKDSLIRRRRVDEKMPTEWVDLLQARLVGDAETESRLRFGIAIRDGFLYSYPDDPWDEVLLSALIPLISIDDSVMVGAPLLKSPQERGTGSVEFIDANTLSRYALDLNDILMRFCVLRGHELSAAAAESAVKRLLANSTDNPRRSWALVSLISAYPGLLDTFPTLRTADMYSAAASLVLKVSPNRLDERLRSLAQSIELHFFPSRETTRYNYYKFTFDQLKAIEEFIAAHRVAIMNYDTGKPSRKGVWPSEKNSS